MNTLKVKIDDVLTALRKNAEGQDTVLIDSSYSGGDSEVGAHERQLGNRWLNPSAVLELRAFAFLTGTEKNADVPRGCIFPSRADEKARFREEYDLDSEAHPTDHPEWDAWWEGVCGVWREEVKRRLVEEVEIQHNGERRRYSVEYVE